MKVSWVILTHNRSRVVSRAFDYNLFHMLNLCELEIIHIDNGSRDIDRVSFMPCALKIQFATNQGVAKGYNAGLVHATGDYILITGCDRLMPKDFLNKMLSVASNSNVGIASIYSRPVSQCKERMEKHSSLIGVNGLAIHEGLPLEAKLIPMPLFKKIGYFHEGFGLYGYEDLEWADRAQRVAKENGLTNYVLVDEIAQHLGSEGIEPYNGADDREYYEFKKRECSDPAKAALVLKLKAEGNPYYNPFL